MPPKYRSLADLEKNLETNEVTGCINWKGRYVTKDGNIEIPWGGQSRLVHRIIYEYKKGKIPVGVYVIRTCGHNTCCNVDHMSLKHTISKVCNTVDEKLNAIEESISTMAPVAVSVKAHKRSPKVLTSIPSVNVGNKAKTICMDFGGVKITISN